MNVLEVNFEKKLKNFPLHIQFQAEGGCIGILGASGCGKSMTAMSVMGLLRHPGKVGKVLRARSQIHAG